MSKAPWKATVYTLFPDLYPGPLGCSVIGNALKEGVWSLDAVNIRDYAHDKHKTVDDSPFGGGPGMVMRPDVIAEAIEKNHSPEAHLIYLSPRGRPFTQGVAKELSQKKQISLICGRFEGIDERVVDHYGIDEMSIGDYILSGGEYASYCILDACVRLLPGVLGSEESLDSESFEGHLLEYPHYTKPRVWNGREVPEVLLSGDHGKIAKWRREQSEDITRRRRPDMWQKYSVSKE